MTYEEAVEKLRKLWDMGFADVTVRYEIYAAYRGGVRTVPRMGAGETTLQNGSGTNYLWYKAMKVRAV